MNTKIFHKIFWIGIVLPVVLMFLLDKLTNLLGIRIDTPTLNNVGYILLGISVIGCITLLIKNYETKVNNPAWYILGVIFILLNAGLFYVIESLSHFGF